MSDTTPIRAYESDKERIRELADDDKNWPAKVAQIVEWARQNQERHQETQQ